jgi:hypothetical protein
MNNPNPNESIEYLTSKENLPYTLDILQQGGEIRRRALSDFWHAVREDMRNSVPKTLGSEQLQWMLWPDARRMDVADAGLWSYPSQFARQTHFASYFVSHYNGSSYFQIYFGLSWENEQAAKSGLMKLPAVKRLIQHLSENEFRQTRWDLGYKSISPKENRDAFLLKYAKNADEIHRQIQESFWPFVNETFGTMMKANEAIRRAT